MTLINCVVSSKATEASGAEVGSVVEFAKRLQVTEGLPSLPGIDALRSLSEVSHGRESSLRSLLAAPLDGSAVDTGEWPIQTDLVVAGQAPGDQEVERRTPFVGPAGKALRRALALVGVDESKVYFTNTVLCSLPIQERTRGRRGTQYLRRPPARRVRNGQDVRSRGQRPSGSWRLVPSRRRGVTGRQLVISKSRASLLRRPLRPNQLNGDGLVGITHHPSAPLTRSLIVDDIRALLSFPYKRRTPNVYRSKAVLRREPEPGRP